MKKLAVDKQNNIYDFRNPDNFEYKAKKGLSCEIIKEISK